MAMSAINQRPCPKALLLVLLILAAFVRPTEACDFDIAFGPVHPPQRLTSIANASSYFIELRARGGSPVGHSYVVLGVRTATGKERIVRMAGFYASMGAFGAAGSVIGVPGEVGYKKSDLGKPSVRYRRMLTRNAFAGVERTIGRISKNPGKFIMLSNNCNAFVGRLARSIGLKTPRSTAIYAPDYLKKLIALNRRRG